MKSKVFLLATILISFGVTLAIIAPLDKGEAVYLEGYMLISDAGVPSGGFEWVGEYNLSLVYGGGLDKLEIRQIAGLGDYLERHVYRVESLYIDDDYISMVVEGVEIKLVREGDYYVAAYSIEAEYLKGDLDPSFLEGIPPHFYVEIRLSPLDYR